LKGKRRKKIWARLERDYRFARELWSPKSVIEREFGSKMDIESERGIWVNLDIGFRSKRD
jgi:hypothetical protein